MISEVSELLLAYHIHPLEMALRLSLAVIFGLIVGWERETRDKPAGVRTHMMVSLGSASFMLATLEFGASPLRFPLEVAIDPSRIIQGVITGIGFLGAGCIIRGDSGIRGLKTGASVWVVGSIGVACGSGLYVVAAIITVFTYITVSIHRISANVNPDVD